ncbi:hypothetical protein PCASD_20063 [Puccinia coronata f. sp. avenae]|uniref:Nuclear pore protein n=1 Tax=Puccinia coronata f. sp. avenae TaxID=200324 RepID=A0A2N5TTQ9_9BASI|nr:hypothetical protein PCASD_20063 [Puccinia coronata f. sp. avenae]
MRRNWEEQKELLFEELACHQPQSSSEGGNMLSMFSTHSSLKNLSDMANLPTSSPEHSSQRSQSRLPFSDSTNFGGIQSGMGSRANSSQADMHGKMMKYDQAVTKLNQRRLQSAYFPIVHAFKDASLSFTNNNGKSSQNAPLTDTWNCLSQLVQEKNTGLSDQDNETIGGIRLTTIPAKRKYAKHYLGDPQSLEAKNVRKQLADGAKAHLEQQFLTHMSLQIAAHPQEATLGGDPSTANKIMNNTPVWARIFYLMRIGQIPEDLKFTKAHEQHIRKTEPNFLSYFSSWASNPDRRLSKTLRDQFLAEYNQRTQENRNSKQERPTAGINRSNTAARAVLEQPCSTGGRTDTVRPKREPTGQTDLSDRSRLVLCNRSQELIGQACPTRRQMLRSDSACPTTGRTRLFEHRSNCRVRPVNAGSVPVAIASMEDWIWLQLVLVKETDPALDHPVTNNNSSVSSTHDRYCLEEFAQVIAKYGESHFDPNGNRPLMYFRVLLMSGQFEKAFLFLQQKPHFQVDAVHFAIALSYYGLLRISDSAPSSEGSASSPKGRSSSTRLPSVNFARLIYRYTRLFAKITFCHTYIGNLAVETTSREEILGDMRNNGTRIPGMIERDLSLIKLSNHREYLETIVKQAAERAFRERRLRDAIRLFNIAEEYDRVIAVINIELASSLFQPGSKQASSRIKDDMNGSGVRPKGATVSLTASKDIAAVANNVLAHYDRTSTISSHITRKNRNTCALLLRLKTVLDLHEQGKNEQALTMLDSLDLLPTGNDLVQLIRKSEQVKDLDDTIAIATVQQVGNVPADSDGTNMPPLKKHLAANFAKAVLAAIKKAGGPTQQAGTNVDSPLVIYISWIGAAWINARNCKVTGWDYALVPYVSLALPPSIATEKAASGSPETLNRLQQPPHPSASTQYHTNASPV